MTDDKGREPVPASGTGKRVNDGSTFLADSEDRMKFALELTRTGAWDLNLEDRTAHRTLLHARIFGYESLQESWTYEKFLGHVVPEERAEVARQFREATSAQRDWSFECRIRRVDGAERWIWVAGHPLRADRNGLARLFGIVQDITERKMAEMALRESEEKYRTLFREMLDGFALHEIICDDAGRPVDYRFLAVNPAFERLTGLKAEDVLGRTVREVLPGIEPEWIGSYGHVALTGEPILFQDFSVELGKHFEVRAFRPAYGQFACIFQDVTEVKRIEARLRVSEKMEAIGQLAGGIAHDFNNVLAGILGYAEMSLAECGGNTVLEGNLQRILQAVNRAKSLVQKILAFSRQSESLRLPLELKPVIEEVLELLRATIPSSVLIVADLDQPVDRVLADSTQLHEVLLNLVTNAVHAMNGKGTLTLRLYSRHLDRPVQGQASIGPGDYTVIEVQDTGCGMGQRVRAKVFEPFFTTKNVGEGSGMGLSVALGIVQAHGGGLEMESEEGRGATFRVYLPRVEAAAVAEEPEADWAPVGGTERVLFVDDEPTLAELARKQMTALGYAVTALSDSRQALEFIRERGSEVDILVTDLTMPFLTGVELAKEARRVRPGLPIILCTGFSTMINPARARAVGITQLASKPLGQKELDRMIRSALDAQGRS